MNKRLVMLILTTMLLIFLYGCKLMSNEPILTSDLKDSDIVAVEKFESPRINVAPVFMYGDGILAGKDDDWNQVTLTDDEVLTVLNEVGLEYGYVFTLNEVARADEVNLTVFGDETEYFGDMYEKVVDMTADFVDEEHDILIEFVSAKDAKNWLENTNKGDVTKKYETSKAAIQLHNGIFSGYGTEFVGYVTGIVYDPCSIGSNGDDIDDIKQRSIDDLRTQISVFFKWLFS